MTRSVALCAVLLVVVAGCSGLPGASSGPSAGPTSPTPDDPQSLPETVLDRSAVVSTVTTGGPYEESELSLTLYYVDNESWYAVGDGGEPASRVPEAAETATGVAVTPPEGYVWKVTVAADEDGVGVDHGTATVMVNGTTGEVMAHHRVVSGSESASASVTGADDSDGADGSDGTSTPAASDA
ncbi:MAG: hypothetical protein ABEJ79_06910 [Halolamina sp.]